MLQADERTGAPAASYELALTDQDFKFPQVWRSNIAVDRRLPGGITGTAEFIYNRDVNGVYYINANLPAAQAAFTGADNRPRAVRPPAANRINNATGNQVTNATVMKNQNVGRSGTWRSRREEHDHGPGAAGYNYGESKNTVDPGSIAIGSWSTNEHRAIRTTPASRSPTRRRATASSSPATTPSGTSASAPRRSRPSGRRRTIGNASYIFAADINGDGGTANDLIYIQRNRRR